MYSKNNLLARFRENADKELIIAKSKSKDDKKQADYLNKAITGIKDAEIQKLERLNISAIPIIPILDANAVKSVLPFFVFILLNDNERASLNDIFVLFNL